MPPSRKPFPLPCVIFAGGKSSRMGRDKALLPFGGFDTLARYQFERLSPLFTQTYLSVKTPHEALKGIPQITDAQGSELFAPTAGFIAAFHTLKAERLFILSVDTPFIGPEVIAALLEADANGLDAVIARTEQGTHPLCGIYHRSLRTRFEAMAASGDHALGRMLSTVNTRYVRFEKEELFANLNHPHEYEAALESLAK